MNVKFRCNPIKRILTVFLILGVIFIFLRVLSAYFLTTQIQQHRASIETQLKKTIPNPISFEEVKIKWSGFTLMLSLQSVRIFHSEKEAPFVSIKEVKIPLKPLDLVLKKEFTFDKIVLKGLKMSINLDDQTQKPSDFFALLSKKEVFILQDAELEIRKGKDSFYDRINGEFRWVKSKTQEWVFEGTQQLQIRQNAPLPKSHFKISSAPNQELELQFGNARTGAQCTLNGLSEAKFKASCTAKVGDIEFSKLRAYFTPIDPDPKLLKWLHAALLEGNITHGQFTMEGSETTWQWKGNFAYEGVSLQYAPQWPALDNAKGSVNIEPDKIQVVFSKGFFLSSPIQNATVVISPLGKGQTPRVKLEAVIQSDLEGGLEFLEESPLKTSVGSSLSSLNPTGPMQLSIQLEVPLEQEKTTVAVEGVLATQKASFSFPERDISLKDVSGEFHFTNTTLESPKVKGILNDERPIELVVTTTTKEGMNWLNLTTEDRMDMESLRERFHFPLLDKLEGQTQFFATLQLPLMQAKAVDAAHWIIESNLEGVSIHLPGVFAKTKEEAWKVSLDLSDLGAPEKKIGLTIQDRLDSKWMVIEEEDSYQLKRGNLVFGNGKAEWISKDALVIGGTIETLNVSEWSFFLKNLNADNPTLRDTYFPPLDIRVLATQLDVLGMLFQNTWLSADFSKKPLSWGLEGPSIQGMVTLPTADKNAFTVDLVNLTLNSEGMKKNDAELSELEKILIHFKCQNCQFDNRRLGEVTFSLTPIPYGYAVSDLKLGTSVYEITGAGEWHFGKANFTLLQGKMISHNLGEMMNDLGFSSAIRESKGYLNYTVAWGKGLFDLDVNTLDGTAQFQLDKGRILGVNPGLGRILGLLSLRNITQRLKLDFSDLFKKGFVFNTLRGKFKFQKGVAITEEPIQIDGPSASINLQGKAFLKDHAVDLTMAVTPKTGVGIPLAVGVAAVNPLAGAGIWFFDQVTGKISEMTQHTYHVTGTWDKPSLQEMSSARKRGSNSSSPSPNLGEGARQGG